MKLPTAQSYHRDFYAGVSSRVMVRMLKIGIRAALQAKGKK